MVSERLDDVLDASSGALESNSQFTHGCQGPADNGVTPVSPSIMLVQDVVIDVNNLNSGGVDRRAIFINSLTVG